MPLPLLFIGFAAVASGAAGVGGTIKAADDKSKAKKIIEISNKKVSDAQEELITQRDNVSTALDQLGAIKVEVLKSSVMRFLDSFEQIKNVDFNESSGLNEIKNLQIDKKEFEELRTMGNFAIDVTEGLVAGTGMGALTAFGAWSAAGAYATASTGTAISTLSGIAAHNATLAFFGGGSIASGGLGMAGGAMVLGGMVAGPALLATGLVTSIKAQQQLDEALTNKAEAEKTAQELKLLALQCSAIRRRSYMFYTLLSRLDLQFTALIQRMEQIIENEGTDYSKYEKQSKKSIASVASIACTIKSILDTPILDGDGNLTEESDKLIRKINNVL